MDTKFNTKFELQVEPVYHDKCTPPWICLKFNDQIVFDDFLTVEKNFTLEQDLAVGRYSIELIFNNKNDSDVDKVRNLDKAIIIKQVKFEEISTDKLKWQAKYYPMYPEAWANEQKNQGIELKTCINSASYLGWNGTWKLEFSVPIYHWIHDVENLGWVYNL